MLFIFKKKPVVLDCFTCNPTALLHPISNSVRHIPEWWKKIGKVRNEEIYNQHGVEVPVSTMKNCVGFIFKIESIILK